MHESFQPKSETPRQAIEHPEKIANEAIELWTDNLLKLDALYKRATPSSQTDQDYAETRSGVLAQIDKLMQILEELEERKGSAHV